MGWSKRMKNDILEFYIEQDISPVHQDITDLDLHIERRRKLYRQCGIPYKLFYGKQVLEIGPGSGYNTLAFFKWGANVTLVEPNPKGLDEAGSLFEKMGINEDRYDFIQSKIEDYRTDEIYDIVIAEGFLEAMDNQDEIIKKIDSLVESGGIVVVTCADDVCMFIETMKRLIAVIYTEHINEYDQKVEYLEKFFAQQFKKLRGMSRPVKDWVEDQMICKSFINGNSLSMEETINKFVDYYYIGFSQRLFTDYSWYKDIWYDEKDNIVSQFRKKRLSLLMAGMDEVIVKEDEVNWFVHRFKEIRYLVSEFENSYDKEIINKIEHLLKDICLKADVFPNEFRNVLLEIHECILDIVKKGRCEISKYSNFYYAFGRTQQYIAFEKK